MVRLGTTVFLRAHSRCGCDFTHSSACGIFIHSRIDGQTRRLRITVRGPLHHTTTVHIVQSRITGRWTAIFSIFSFVTSAICHSRNGGRARFGGREHFFADEHILADVLRIFGGRIPMKGETPVEHTLGFYRRHQYKTTPPSASRPETSADDGPLSAFA